MNHPNKNQLISLFFNEIDSGDKINIESHVNQCSICRQYLQTIDQVNGIFSGIKMESPAPETLDYVIKNTSAVQIKPAKAPMDLMHRVFIEIGCSLLGIIMLIYILQKQIILLPVWQSIHNLWLFQQIGSVGFVILSIFGLISFVSLALSPILILEGAKNRTILIR
ncbi:hypothetical protein JW964_14505 [candidate division KSB1 bacterium]|nr:hypothetical protein [candidate division KSB1 bacterium]